MLTTRVEPEVFVPPLPGAAVRRAEGAAREQALYFDQMEQRLPIGLDHRDEPLYANLEFIDGSRGAHVNISGISGVATKTTYASFLLFSLFNSGVLGAEAKNTKALIFNVKGEDLLFLDHDNARLTDLDRERYRRMGLEPKAFDSVRVYAPPRRRDAHDRCPYLLLDHCRVRRRRVAAVPLRRRGGRAAAVHDGPAQRGRPPEVRRPARRRRRRVEDRRHHHPHLRAAVRRHLRERRGRQHSRAVGGRRDGHRYGERVHPQAAFRTATARASDPRRRRRARRPPGAYLRRQGDRRRPAQPARPGQAIRRRCDDSPDVRREGSVGVRAAVALHRARRAEQVRAVAGRLAHQGDPARCGRARAFARDHPHRRATDRERGRAPGDRELVDPRRRAARSCRGAAARVRVLVGRAPPAGHDREAGNDVRLPTRDPGSARGHVPVPGVGDPTVGARRYAGARSCRRSGTSRS